MLGVTGVGGHFASHAKGVYSFASMAVLIVEDDPALGRLLCTLMVRERLGVEIETRGDAALPTIESGRYSAILLDLMLPGMSGFDIVDHVARVRPALLRRIIVITAVSQSQLRRFEHRSAIWDLIRKPFDVSEFVGIVRDCVLAHAPRRFEEIEELTRCLADAATACGARAALVATESGSELTLRATFGYTDGVLEEYFPLPLDGNYPLCEAVRTRRPVWLASLTQPSPDYRLLPIWTMNDARSLAVTPLLRGDSHVGAIGWSFAAPQRFDAAQRAMLQQMAGVCAEMLAEQHA